MSSASYVKQVGIPLPWDDIKHASVGSIGFLKLSLQVVFTSVYYHELPLLIVVINRFTGDQF